MTSIVLLRLMRTGGVSLAGSSATHKQGSWLESKVLLRVITGLVGIPIVVFITYLGGIPFRLVVGAAAFVGAMEGYQMLRQRDHQPALLLGLLLALGLALSPAFPHPWQWTRAILALGTIAAGLWFLFAKGSQQTFLDWALTVIVALYVGMLLGSMISLRDMHNGFRLVLVVLILTWSYDTGAYIAGRLWGRHPFMQHISASKTWEGVAGGVVLSVLIALVCAVPFRLPVTVSLVLGLGIAIASQTGDLVESLMKRYSGVKDSGTIIPGHGGLLDRIDSLLFSGTVGLYVLVAAGYH